MTEDISGLGKALDAVGRIVDSNMAHRLYDDAVREPLTEVSGICHDILAGARLFTTPFVLAATYRDRLLQYIAEVRERVPESHQTEAEAHIAGPVFERLRFLERENTLTELYLQILQSAIDDRTASNVHPAFVEILGQLSRDEALTLFYLKQHGQLKAVYSASRDAKSFTCSRIRADKYPTKLEALDHPERLFVYLTRMQSLTLTHWPYYCEQVHRLDCGCPVECLCTLTQFGELFADACIPESLE